MEDLEKNFLINELFDIYGELLSTTQQKMITLYYMKDLSLSEISIQENVSRNAVYDALKKGIDSLNKYEEKLSLVKRRNSLIKKVESLKKELNEVDYNKVIELFKEEL